MAACSMDVGDALGADLCLFCIIYVMGAERNGLWVGKEVTSLYIRKSEGGGGES